MADFLDITGLDRFLGKIKSIFALKADTYTKSEVDTLVAEGGGGDGEIDIDLLVPITWAELKALRDAGELVAGTQYRITDYLTKVDAGDDCTSEQYPFDIIVTADSENALNEHARAINHPKKRSIKTIYVEDDKHNTFLYERYEYNDSENLFGWKRLGYENVTPEMVPIDWDDSLEFVQVSIDIEKLSIGDEFTIEGKNVKLLSIFDEVDHFKNCNLAAWELKYCLDNDKSRFDWANEDYGRGVIYYMKDEWGNECPYDFKNIKFKHRFNEDGVIVREQDEYVSTDYVYTFCCNANNKNAYYIVDASIFCNDGTLYGRVKNNIIKPYISNGQQKLNNNVFFSHGIGCVFSRNILSHNCHDNIFNFETIDNHLGVNCYKNYSFGYFQDNTLADECFNNYFSGEIHYNVLGFSCCENSLSGECCNNEFGEWCSNIILEGDCYYNTFGHHCSEINMLDSEGNQFGRNCRDILLDTECNYNTFGHGCRNNTLEYYCDDNRIDNNCYHIYLETDCCCNHIGEDCDDVMIRESSHYNNIGDRCSSIDFEEDHYFYVTVLANTQYETITGIEPNASYPQVCGYDENDNYIAKPMLSNVSSTGGSAINDVSIFAVYGYAMYIRAPKGLLRESDTPIFARYTKSKIRGIGDEEEGDSINYWVGDRSGHEKVNGWIVPRVTMVGGKHIKPQDSFRFAKGAYLEKWTFEGDGCTAWNDDGYDYFRLFSEDGDDFIDYLNHARNNYFVEPLNIIQKKLGIRIDRDGKTIVDYLPFAFQENEDGDYFFAKWR